MIAPPLGSRAVSSAFACNPRSLRLRIVEEIHNRTLGNRLPSPPFQIDRSELIQALKQERTAKTILNRGSVDRGEKQRDKNVNSSGDVEEKQGADAQSPRKSLSHPSQGGAGHPDTTSEAEQTAVLGSEKRPDKEERPLFSVEEVESVAAYLVESQQAASLINVADIQHSESVKIALL